MLTIYIYAFISVIIVSFVSFVGVFSLTLKDDFVKKYIGLFISLAVGALLGDSFIHLIPETFEKSSGPTLTGLLIIIGILIFFILEKFLHWHHCHEPENCITHSNKNLAIINLVGDAFHNFIDGAIIAGSFLAGPIIGLSTTIAVIIHEIPQEIGDFGILLHAGLSRKKALFFNFLSALFAFLGLFIVFIFSGIENMLSFVLPLTAGGFIYIALADLIPELHKENSTFKSIFQIITFLLGITTMSLLLLLE